MFEELELTKNDKYYLLFIFIFSIILVGYYIHFNDNLGIYCSDVYVYLLNSLYYAGNNIHSTGSIYLSPLICFLTSVFFRLGFVSKFAIYIVTGAFAVFGNIGLYLLFKRFFNETLSLTGTVIYSSTTLYLTWLANGTLDIPAVSMIIWMALFTYLAINRNPKYYIPLILFIVLGVFTRYTVLLTLPAFLLYYVHEKGFHIDSEDLKYIIKGIVIGAVITAVTLALVLSMGHGHFAASGQISDGISGAQGAEIDPAYNTDAGYYLFNMLNFVSNTHTVIDGNPVLANTGVLSYVILIILIAGLALWIYDSRRSITREDLFALLMFIIGIVSFTRISAVVTTLFILIGIYLMGKNSENKIVYFMLAWIFSNFIFFSYYSIKVNRYVLPTFPAIIYFVLLSIDTIHNHFKINKNIIPLLLIAVFVIQAFAFTFTFEPTEEFRVTEDISDYIISNNPDYESLHIGVYNIRPFSWWLGANATGIESSNEKAIDESNVTYYISNEVLNNLTNYTEIKNIDEIHLYKKSSV